MGHTIIIISLSSYHYGHIIIIISSSYHFTNGKNPKISKNIEKSMIPFKMLRISWLCPRRAIVSTKSRISKKKFFSIFRPPNQRKCCLSIFFWPILFLIKNWCNSVKKILFWSKQIILWSNFRFFLSKLKLMFEKYVFFGLPSAKKSFFFVNINCFFCQFRFVNFF